MTYEPALFHRHLEAMANTAENFVAIAALDGSVLWVNDFGRAMVGMPDNFDVTTSSIADYLTEEGLRASVEIEQPAVVAKGSFAGVTTLKDWRTGEGIPVEVNSRLLFDPSTNEPYALATIQRDIRADLARQAVIDQLTREREASRRLESLGEFASGIAHDFNNILGVIVMGADYALTKAPESELVRELNAIKAAALEGSALTRQLLSFSRRDSFQLERLELGEVVSSALALVQRMLDSSIEVEVRRTASDVVVVADRNAIFQILLNLVLNARDALGAQGRISVSVGAVEGDAGAPTAACVAVEDNGVGMSVEVRDRAFEPFFTTKSRGQGTGMGLATTHGIVQQLGGTIAVESEVGKGTRVTVTLPVAPPVSAS
ncbi:MAG: PAS domain-containing protein [Acidobacteriota bacterium]|nr:PAS domain-containing protein [Acidobacteriota bacterium]